jgi:hypothetical protein
VQRKSRPCMQSRSIILTARVCFLYSAASMPHAVRLEELRVELERRLDVVAPRSDMVHLLQMKMKMVDSKKKEG